MPDPGNFQFLGSPGPYIGPGSSLFARVNAGGTIGNVVGIKTAVTAEDLIGGGFFDIGPPAPPVPAPDYNAIMGFDAESLPLRIRQRIQGNLLPSANSSQAQISPWLILGVVIVLVLIFS